MFRKSPAFALILVVLVTACSPAAPVLTPVSTLQVNVEVSPSVVPSPVATTASAVIPKHNDLIFIEFFAVT